MRVVGAVLAAAGGVLLVPLATPAVAAPTHVAIVIAGQGVSCVSAGGTGDAILNAVARVHYRATDGLIDQINGTPTPAHADATHYWSYWHDTGSGWQYSSSGASGYTPRAGTVEGWSFVNGASAASPPPRVSYAAVCGAKDPPPTRPKPTRTHPTPPHPSTSQPAVVRTSAAGSVATSSPPPSASSTRRVLSTSAPRTTSRPASAASGAVVGTGSPSTSAATPSTSLPTLSKAAGDPRHDPGSPTPAVVAGGLVLALGSAAVWLTRRRRASG